MKKVIAVVGPIASGKTTVANILADKYEFSCYRLNQALYDEVDRRGLDRTERVVLQDVADDMRAKDGPAVLAKIITETIKKEDGENYVIESIRNHNEVLEIKKSFGEEVTVISVDTPIEIRYKRAVERKGQYKEQELTFEEFKRNSERDLGEGNAENEQNVKKCMELADIEISNEGTIDELDEKIEDIIK